MGLLDNYFGDNDPQSPQNQQMMAMAASLLQSSGPSRTPIGLGQSLGHAMMAGQGAFQNARDNAIQMDLLNRRKAQEDLATQMNEFKFGQQKQVVEDQNAQRAAMIEYAKNRARFNSNGNPMESQQDQQPMQYKFGADGNGSFASSPSPMRSIERSAPQQSPQGKTGAIQAQINELNNQADFFDSKGLPTGDAYRQKALELTKMLPKYANEYRVVMGADGVPRNMRLGDDGSEIVSNAGVAEKLHFGDNGQQLLGINQYTGKPMVISGKLQSPDSVASNAVTMRGQNMTDARAKAAQELQTRPSWNNEVGAFIAPPSAANPNGQKIDLQGYTKPDKPLTEVQAKAVTFASRMNNANEIMNKLSANGIDKLAASTQFSQGIPLVSGLSNAITSPDHQMLEQAQRDWGNANLRNESGAAIGKDEFDSLKKQYFPQFGDSPEVIRQKANNRLLAENGMRTQAGAGEKNIDSIVSNSTSNNSSMPKTKLFKLDGGGSTAATLGDDGKYYVVKNGKKYRVEE